MNKNIRKQELLPLHYAVSAGKIESIELLSRNCNIVVDTSCLWLAASSGSSEAFEEIVGKMLQNGNCTLKEIFDIRFDDSLNNPLHVIAFSKNYKYFLNHKFPVDTDDVIAQNGDSDTVLHILMKELEIREFLPLLAAVCEKFPRLLTLLNRNSQLSVNLNLTMNEVGDENLITRDVETALQFLESLIERANCQSLKFIIESFNSSVIEEHGNRLLHSAIKHSQSNLTCFDYFLNHPSNINPNVFHDGSNAFLRALAGANWHFAAHVAIYMIEALLKVSAIEDVDAVDSYGNSLLMYAVACCPDMHLIEFLIRVGAACATTNDNGCSLLHFVVKNQTNEEVLQFLVERGVEPSTVDKIGQKAVSEDA